MSESLRTDDLIIPQGTDYRVQWPIRDGAGEPLPSMTGWTARAQARARVTAPDTLAEWSTEDGGITLADSTLTLHIGAAQSTAWAWTSARYDVEITAPTGEITRLTQGRLSVDPEVTR